MTETSGAALCLETGIRGVKRGLLTPSDNNEEWVIKTEGTNMQGVIQIDGVDTTRTVSNHIHEIEKLYGIEAARKMIITESQKVLEQQGLDVDLRHLLILSDLSRTRPLPISLMLTLNRMLRERWHR